MTRKAIPHILIGITGVVALIFLPDNIARIVGLTLSWGYIAFFRQQMKSDIQELNRFDVKNAHWFSAFFMSVGLYGIVIIGGIVFIFFQGIYESMTPGHVSYYSDRGYKYLEDENYDLAIAEYTKAIDLDPTLASLYYNRGVAYGHKSNYDLAIADYSKSIELDPEYVDAFINRGIAYSSTGDYDQAFHDFNKAIELNPNDPFPFYNRAIAFETIGNYESALADYDRAIELNFNYPGVYINRGLLHKSLGHKSDAIKDFEKVLEISTDPNLRQQVEGELKELKGQ